jgi:hypothetical protein
MEIQDNVGIFSVQRILEVTLIRCFDGTSAVYTGGAGMLHDGLGNRVLMGLSQQPNAGGANPVMSGYGLFRIWYG